MAENNKNVLIDVIIMFWYHEVFQLRAWLLFWKFKRPFEEILKNDVSNQQQF